MSIRIFPLNANENPFAFYNRSSYLKWLDFEQNSLSEYIRYSHPPYQIAGESVFYIDQNNKHIESNPNDFSSDNYLWIDEDGEYPPVYCIAGLKYHQGLYNKFLNAKIFYGSKNELTNGVSSQAIEVSKLPNFPTSTVIFANQWTHKGYQEDSSNAEFKKENFYKFIPRAEPAFYFPRGLEKSVSFTLVEDSLSVAGNGMVFSIDTSPMRYAILDDASKNLGSQSTWTQNSGGFKDGTLSVKIGTIENKIWTNSYPLMRDFEIKENNKHEEFFIDAEDTIGTIKIDNMMFYYYNIDTNNTSDWEDKLKVILY